MPFLNKFLGSCGFILLLNCITRAQTIVSGRVSDTGKSPIVGASVQLKTSEGKTLAFAISKKDGSFKVQTNHLIDSLFFSIKSISHQYYEKKIPAGTHLENLFLEDQVQALQEVKITSAVAIKGDTVSFKVDKFLSERDRSIADVIKKMPGMEVGADGTIKHQGKEINKFYVEGLDPVGGRYANISENLNYQKVDKVELFENHQPIKTLEGKVFSDEPALNLRLKQEWTTQHRVAVGTGVEPLLYQANYNPMVFNRKKQFVGNFATNNTGNWLENQNRVLSRFDAGNRGNGLKLGDWADIQKLSNPSIPSKYWLDNHSTLMSVNSIFKAKNQWQNRVNLNLNLENASQQGKTINTVFTPNNTTQFTETNEYTLANKTAQLDWVMEKNVDKNFSKNDLKFTQTWHDHLGNLTNNNLPVKQELNGTNTTLSNQLQVFGNWKNMNTRFDNFIGYSSSPQIFEVDEDIFKISNGSPIIDQNTLQKKWNISQDFGLSKTVKNFTLNPSLSADIEKNNLESDISPVVESKRALFKNNLDWFKQKYGAHLAILYNTDYLKIGFVPKIAHVSINNEDLQLNKSTQLSRNVFEPSFNFNWTPNALWQINLTSSRNWRFGNMEHQYYGYLFRNYRQLGNVNSKISETESRIILLNPIYKNLINGITISANCSYNNMINNLIEKNQINPQGFNTVQFIEKTNRRETFGNKILIGKSIIKHKTNLSLEGHYNLSKSPQIINDITQKSLSKTWMLIPKANYNALSWLNFEYEFNYTNHEVLIEKVKTSSFTTQTHSSQLIFLAKNKTITLEGDYIQNKINASNNSYLFGNLKLNQRIGKKKQNDLSFTINNLADTQTYQNFLISNQRIIESQMTLRPRQYLVKFTANI